MSVTRPEWDRIGSREWMRTVPRRLRRIGILGGGFALLYGATTQSAEGVVIGLAAGTLAGYDEFEAPTWDKIDPLGIKKSDDER